VGLLGSWGSERLQTQAIDLIGLAGWTASLQGHRFLFPVEVPLRRKTCFIGIFFSAFVKARESGEICDAFSMIDYICFKRIFE
jgi:hypothetical protein